MFGVLTDFMGDPTNLLREYLVRKTATIGQNEEQMTMNSACNYLHALIQHVMFLVNQPNSDSTHDQINLVGKKCLLFSS